MNFRPDEFPCFVLNFIATHQESIGLDSHFSGGSVSFRDYTSLVKMNMYAPGYVTVAKSGPHTLSNSGLESKAFKEEPPRGYYIPSMAK